MEVKYQPTKTALTLAEHKELLATYSKENKKLAAQLDEAIKGLEFARGKLIEVQEENRKLKLIILRMTEGVKANEQINS